MLDNERDKLEETYPTEKKNSKKEVKIPEKWLLTIDEAVLYTGLGHQKIRDISNGDDCDFVLWNGSKRMLKRVKLEQYLDKLFSI